MNVSEFNLLASVHNLQTVSNAETLLKNFIKEDGVVYAYNPDGSCMKLHKDFKLFAYQCHAMREE